MTNLPGVDHAGEVVFIFLHNAFGSLLRIDKPPKRKERKERSKNNQ
jgi:hypothetical protein